MTTRIVFRCSRCLDCVYLRSRGGRQRLGNLRRIAQALAASSAAIHVRKTGHQPKVIEVHGA